MLSATFSGTSMSTSGSRSPMRARTLSYRLGRSKKRSLRECPGGSGRLFKQAPALFFSIWVSSDVTGPTAVNRALDQIDAVREALRTHPHDLMLATTAADV